MAGFLVLACALALLIFGGHSGPRFGDTISFLKGKESTRKEEILHVPTLAWSVAKVKPSDMLWITDTYVFEEPFVALNARTMPELKSRSFTASAHPKKDPIYQSYALKDNAGETYTVTLSKQSPTETVVQVTEWRTASWMDQAKDWVRNVFRPKPSVAIKLK